MTPRPFARANMRAQQRASTLGTGVVSVGMGLLTRVALRLLEYGNGPAQFLVK